MNKPYLLIAGDHYYPQGDTSDWIGCFSTYEEAREQVDGLSWVERGLRLWVGFGHGCSIACWSRGVNGGHTLVVLSQ